MRLNPTRSLLRLSAVIATALSLLTALPATAQNLFQPVVQVNDRVVTRYELSQRMAFLRLLRAPGDIRQLALDQLIDERLQLELAGRFGLTVSDEDVAAGMAEFASRANLTTQQFIAAIGQGGVSAESYRDFVKAGLVWREIARGLFLSKVSISKAEVDAAIAEGVTTGSGGVLPEELEYALIYIPGGQSEAARAEARRIRGKVDTCDDLYPIIEKMPADRFERHRMLTSQIPSDLALELGWLDDNEVSTSLTRADGQMLVFLMLCERARGLPEGVTRDQVLEFLQNQRLNEFADGYLKELRADAKIIYAN